MPISPTSLPPLDLRATASTLDRIHASYMGGEEAERALTPSEMELRKQLEGTWSLLLNFQTPDQAVPVLMRQYDISRATAYRRCRDSTKLFGDVGNVSPLGVSHLLYEHQMTVLKLALSAKGKDGQPKPDLKAANVAIKQMAMLKGLNKVDAGIVDASAFKGGTFLMQIHVAGAGTRTIDLSRATQLPADEHAQLLAAVEGTGIDADEMLRFIDDAAAGWQGAQEPDEDAEFEEDNE